MEQFNHVNYEQDAKFNRGVVCIFLLVAILIPILSLFGVLKPATESLGIWFQRSGSLIVLFGSIAEYFSIQMHNVFSPTLLANEPLFNTRAIYCLQAKKLMAISALFILTGTVVWGYGDLFV